MSQYILSKMSYRVHIYNVNSISMIALKTDVLWSQRSWHAVTGKCNFHTYVTLCSLMYLIEAIFLLEFPTRYTDRPFTKVRSNHHRIIFGGLKEILVESDLKQT